ncbi:MAG: BamA/TamA family outer membrane protein [Armatimonadetes bacterium]|nr:BamA/TamA family outer membrane protein [Armatimonadota bacterium]
MRPFLLLTLAGLLCATAASAGRLALAPYYASNPHDDYVLGPALVLRGEHDRGALSLGYSVTQHQPRGHLDYQNDRAFGPRLGLDLHLFHEVQPRYDVLPYLETGLYEGHTGGTAGVFYRARAGQLAIAALTAEKLWAMPARSNLFPTASDQIRSYSAAYRADTRDDPLDPRAGERLQLSATHAVRAFGGTRAYLAARASWSRYRGIGEAGAFASRLHAAATGGRPPEQRRLWLPGEGVRGYDLVTNAGNLLGVANAEVRLPILSGSAFPAGSLGTVKHVQLAAFADAGLVRLDGRTWVARAGIGAGLRAPLVAAGSIPMVVRLDVAHGLTRGGTLNSYLALTAPELF